jgi:hypothetical protein
MSGYTSPHVEHLVNAANDPDAPLTRQRTALWILSKGGPAPRYDLPAPPTYAELIAAVMMAEGHLKAADLKVDLGERLTAVLYWMREPEMRSLRLAQGGSGDPWAPVIAEAMLQAGRAAAQRLGHAGDVDPALHKLESMPCPICGRAFG